MKGNIQFIFCLLMFISTIQAQEWLDIRESGQAQKAISSFQNAEIPWRNEKGRGIKPFERWVNHFELKLDENGNLPEAGRNMQEFQTYLRSNPPSKNRSMKLTWVNRGPFVNPGGLFNGIGRVNAFAQDPKTRTTIYAGAAGGGLWKSIDDGKTWKPLTDNLGSLGVSEIAINPVNTNIIYLATGDGDGGDNNSVGVLKSLDGGETWNKTGLDWSQSQTRLIRGMRLDPNNPNTLVVASTAGIFRSLDEGATFTIEASGNYYDLVVGKDTDSTATFYAATATSVTKSTDAGDRWATSYSISGSRRIALAISTNNPSVVYALSANSTNSGLKGIYKTSDSGTNWELTTATPNILGRTADGSDVGGQGWYDLCLAVHPNNPDIVNVGGIYTWKSIDGGKTWARKTTYVHVDKHSLDYTIDNELWEGNDGGLVKSLDAGESFTDKSYGLVISQMYKVGVSQTDRKLISGFQDNGTKVQTASGGWTNGRGGDGMQCHIDPTNSAILYGSFQYGSLFRSVNNGNSWTSIRNNLPVVGDGAWITPHMADLQNPSKIYAGFKGVWTSDDRGNSWYAISDSFSNANLTILEVSSSDPNVLIAGTSSVLRKTTDGGATWLAIKNPGTGMTSILISPFNPDIMYATRSGYTTNGKVYRSIDGGNTWTNISGSTLPNLPAQHIQFYNNGKNGLFLAMDIGVYFTDDSMNGTWELVSEGLPNVEVRDIDIVRKEGKIVIATYGRGIWEASIEPTKPLCTNAGIPKLVSTNEKEYYAELEWPSASGSFNGYQWTISDKKDNPIDPIFQKEKTVKINSLLPDVNYFFHVRAVCDAMETSAYQTVGPFKLGTNCAPTTITLVASSLQASTTEGTYQWIDCGQNTAVAIAGATTRTFLPSKNGNYAVVTNDGICSDTSDCFMYSLTAIDEEALKNGVSFYPNPTKDKVIITANLGNITSYSVSAINGKELVKNTHNSAELTVDLDKFPAGLYLVKVNMNNNKTQTIKITKE